MTPPSTRQARFQEIVLRHLDAAYNLARWLARNDDDAQDIAQEACLRALKFFDGFHGDDARAWLLAVIRNSAQIAAGTASADECGIASMTSAITEAHKKTGVALSEAG